jgi:hypothetical protein
MKLMRRELRIKRSRLSARLTTHMGEHLGGWSSGSQTEDFTILALRAAQRRRIGVITGIPSPLIVQHFGH